MPLIIPDLTPAPCDECGMSAVHHGLERFSLRLDSILKWFFYPLETPTRVITPLIDRVVNRMAPLIASFLFKAGLAVKVPEPDEHYSETSLALWHEAKLREIEMYEVRLFGLPRRHFIARHGGISFAFEGIPRLAREQQSIAWIDDKLEVKKRFEKEGFPVARGERAASENEAVSMFHSLRKPVIVKPQEGSGGRHTTVKIETEEELREAYRNAHIIAPSAIVEEELAGPVFRATLIDKKLAAVLRRDPPQVKGDGHSTIRELVAEENKNPLRRGPVFAEIKIDAPAARRELARQNLAAESVPEAGRIVFFHFKVNWGVGGISRDATPEVHPDNKKLFEDIGKFLGEDVVGIDFIIEDISQPWHKAERCGVIECNSLPLIGNHHFPYAGPVRNVAGAIWDMVFPESHA